MRKDWNSLMMRGTPVLPSHFGGAPGGPCVRWALAGGSSGGGSVRGAGVTGRLADFSASTRARTSRSKAGANVFSPAASRACRASPRYTNRKRVATCVEIKIYGAFVLNRRAVLHAIEQASRRNI